MILCSKTAIKQIIKDKPEISKLKQILFFSILVLFVKTVFSIEIELYHLPLSFVPPTVPMSSLRVGDLVASFSLIIVVTYIYMHVCAQICKTNALGPVLVLCVYGFVCIWFEG